MPRAVCGIFVGGQSRRLGGHPKGLLAHPSGQGTLIDHVIRMAIATGAEPVLVGDHPAYAHLGLPMVPDARQGTGPLGGFESLFRYAGPRHAFAVACDMPYVPAQLLEQMQSLMGPDTDAVMPVRTTGREPLCALYRSPRVLGHVEQALRAGRLVLRALGDRLNVVEVPLVGEQAHWLDDWDEPADIPGC